jgi:hypothetical protein
MIDHVLALLVVHERRLPYRAIQGVGSAKSARDQDPRKSTAKLLSPINA